jgi:hypothetical protein
MKLLLYILMFVWMLCGLAGAWWVGDLDSSHWRLIARGPITLAEALNDDPVSYPGPG